MIGRTIGPYRVISKIGEGGMGEVYRAHDHRLDRDVAVKVLPLAVATNADRLARFEREAKALARIEHPNILSIHDFGWIDPDGTGQNSAYAVTELLQGETVRARLSREHLSWRRAIEIAAAVADGLAAAHGQGIVHRDLKPDNLFLTSDGRVKILDFGLATSGLAQGNAETLTAATRLTDEGSVLGTVGYMAPEQVMGAGTDPRSDIFALGCVLYELVAGRRAFARPTAQETLAAILSAPAPELSPASPDAPPELARIVARCLEKQPGERFQSARDLAFALRALITGPIAGLAPTPPPVVHAAPVSPGPAIASRTSVPRVWWAVAAAVFTAVAGGGYWLSHRPAPVPAPERVVAGVDREKVVVAVFANRTGDPSLDALGVQISDWLTQSLSRINIKVAVNPELPSLGGPGTPLRTTDGNANPVRALAEKTGAGIAVTGAYYVDGGSLRVQSQVVDPVSGAIRSSLNPVIAPRDSTGSLVASVANVVLGAVAGRANKAAAAAITETTPPTYDAYLEWTKGMAEYGKNMASAESHFKRCVELDPAFTMARLSLSSVYIAQSQWQKAHPVILTLEEATTYGRATPFEQSAVRFFRAILDGNLQAQLAAATEGARLAPTALNLYRLANTEARNHRIRAALDVLSRIDPAESPAELGPSASWFMLARALNHHQLGEFDKALEAARLGQRHYPQDLTLLQQEAAALVALGRLGEIEPVIGRSQQMVARSGNVGGILQFVAQELSVHGHPAEARSMAARAVAWQESRSEVRTPTPAEQRTLAGSLLLAGDCPRAVSLYRSLANASPNDLEAQSGYAVMIASCGGPREEARAIATALGKVTRPFLMGDQHFYRAKILAALGDGDGAVQALRAAAAQGQPWRSQIMHLDHAWTPIRALPSFIEFCKPRG